MYLMNPYGIYFSNGFIGDIGHAKTIYQGHIEKGLSRIGLYGYLFFIKYVTYRLINNNVLKHLRNK